MDFKLLTCVFVLVAVTVVTDASIAEHEVRSLPLMRQNPRFKHYSGHLKALGNKYLHYWFVESQYYPRGDPLVVWFNGGPGCSSMLGFLTENGPFLINRNATELKMNPYSWNKKANILYIESPAGVGFSYDTYNRITTGDDEVANNNLAAIKYFFEKYPEYKSNSFHLTGESYAGIYIPTLSVKLARESSINFKGVAIGNGLYSYKMNSNSLVYFGYGHGLWDTRTQKNLIRQCCGGRDNLNCDFHGSRSYGCRGALGQALRNTYHLNRYNMYGKCYAEHKLYNMIGRSHVFRHLFDYESQQNDLGEIRESTLGCNGPSPVYAYLNRQDVRRALHIPRHLGEWQLCNGQIFRTYHRQYVTMRPQFRQILATRRLKMFIFNGDVDMACNYLGDEKFVDSLGLRLYSDRTPWTYYDSEGYKQVGGFKKSYNNLQYRTVLGSGHMVPTDKPEAALTMFNEYLAWAR